MSVAYSAMVRSLENLPDAATIFHCGSRRVASFPFLDFLGYFKKLGPTNRAELLNGAICPFSNVARI